MRPVYRTGPRAGRQRRRDGGDGRNHDRDAAGKDAFADAIGRVQRRPGEEQGALPTLSLRSWTSTSSTFRRHHRDGRAAIAERRASTPL